MAAVPIYVWNGTAWQETGPTIPASPIKYQASAPSSPSTGDIWVDSDGDVTSGSTQLVRYRFVASGGETSLSGNDANGATLAYTAGMEQVVLNGAVLVRGYDYTATNGTSISGLSPALVANDVVEVFSFMAFNVANTYTQSQVDGLVAAARAASGLVLLNTTSFTTQTSVVVDNVFNATYDNYQINIKLSAASATDLDILFYLRDATPADVTGGYQTELLTQASTAIAGSAVGTGLIGKTSSIGVGYDGYTMNLYSPFLTVKKTHNARGHWNVSGGTQYQVSTASLINFTTSCPGIKFYPSSGTISGKISIYGYNQ